MRKLPDLNLIGAAVTFWFGWWLMPGVGLTDATAILERVGAQRNAVLASTLLHLLTAWGFAMALPGIAVLDDGQRPHPFRVATAFLGLGACGIAADAIFHFVAWAMTAPGIDRSAVLPVMATMQTTGLAFLIPFVISFFLGAGALAGAASRAGLVSRWNPRLHGIAFAVAIVGGFLLGPRGGGRIVGLVFLGLISASIAWVGVALRRAPAA